MSRVATGKRSPASTRFYDRREKPKLDSYDNNTIQAIFQSSCFGVEEGQIIQLFLESHSKLSKDSSPCLFRVYWRCVPGGYPPSQERGARGGEQDLLGHTSSSLVWIPVPSWAQILISPWQWGSAQAGEELLGPLRLEEAVLEIVFKQIPSSQPWMQGFETRKCQV